MLAELEREDTEVSLSQYLDSADLARLLKIPRQNVYRLPIEQTRLSPKRIRWAVEAVREYLAQNTGPVRA
jgi:hypothetical protein